MTSTSRAVFILFDASGTYAKAAPAAAKNEITEDKVVERRTGVQLGSRGNQIVIAGGDGKNQDFAPLFDTADSDFGLAEIFTPNTFVGNDRIAELTGIRVRETIPDDVLGRADEVVMIDITPEALLERLRAVRRDGYAWVREEFDEGISSVAVASGPSRRRAATTTSRTPEGRNSTVFNRRWPPAKSRATPKIEMQSPAMPTKSIAASGSFG